MAEQLIEREIWRVFGRNEVNNLIIRYDLFRSEQVINHVLAHHMTTSTSHILSNLYIPERLKIRTNNSLNMNLLIYRARLKVKTLR